LKYAAQDEDRTAPQLNFWRVLFDELPDAALDLKETFTFVKDTIQQGQDLVLNMGLTNVSLVDMDSILVNYAIKDATNNVELISKRFAPLNAEEGYALDFGRKSTDLSGDYELTVLVNPNEDQKEQNLFNNFALTRFHVAKDSKNPLLDVTFDGVHILNGDILF